MKRYIKFNEANPALDKDLETLSTKHRKGGKVNLSVYAGFKGIISLGEIVVSKENRNEGLGTKIMKDIIKVADKHGKVIVLTPSGDFGGSKTKLISYYKQFGFVENKGKNKNYSYMDTMYREPK